MSANKPSPEDKQSVSAQKAVSAPTQPLSAAELLFYAPLGIALKIGAKAVTALPELLESGRSEYAKRAPVARLMGKLIVDQQRKKRRAAALGAVPKRPSKTAANGTSETQTPFAKAEAAETKLSANEHPETRPSQSGRSVAPPDLPIDGYDTMPARSLLQLFDGLSADQLCAVLTYEQANRQRATVMNRLAELLG